MRLLHNTGILQHLVPQIPNVNSATPIREIGEEALAHYLEVSERFLGDDKTPWDENLAKEVVSLWAYHQKQAHRTPSPSGPGKDYSFEIDPQIGGTYQTSLEIDAQTEKLQNALNRKDRSSNGEAQYSAEIKKLATAFPKNIDILVHLANVYHGEGEFRLALRTARKARKIAEKALPKNYRGKIIWRYFRNRPYLRALHTQLLCYLATNETEKFDRLKRKLLKLSPDDSLGVRFLP